MVTYSYSVNLKLYLKSDTLNCIIYVLAKQTQSLVWEPVSDR